MHWIKKWQPTPVFLPGESQGRGSLVGCRLWGRTESDTTEATQQQQPIYTSSCSESLTVISPHDSLASAPFLRGATENTKEKGLAPGLSREETELRLEAGQLLLTVYASRCPLGKSKMAAMAASQAVKQIFISERHQEGPAPTLLWFKLCAATYGQCPV